MKKRNLGLACLIFSTVLNISEVRAADTDAGSSAKEGIRLVPAISLGYAFGGSTDTSFTVTNNAASLAGVQNTELNIPAFSGPYLKAELPLLFYDRFTLTLSGSWASSTDNTDASETYNNNIANRRWDVNDRKWYSADLMLSYALVKNMDFVKDISAVIGFRYDYNKIELNNAHAAWGVVSNSLDTIEYNTATYAPLIGITSTFSGFKRGIFGGDIKLGILFSPFPWSNIDYKETFSKNLWTLKYDGNGLQSSFFTVSGEIALLSGTIGSGKDISLALFAQFTEFSGNDTVNGTIAFLDNPASKPINFNEVTNSSFGVIGLKGSIAF